MIGAHVDARTSGLPRLHAAVVRAPGRRVGQPDAAGRDRLADVRPDRLGLGPGPGRAAAVRPRAGAGAGGRPRGRPPPSRAHRRAVCRGTGAGRPGAGAVALRRAAAAHAAADAVGGAGRRARLPDAGTAGAGAAAGAGGAAAARHGLQLGWAAGRHHRRPGAGRLRLRGRRLGGLRPVRAAVRAGRGAVPAHPPCPAGPPRGAEPAHAAGRCALRATEQGGAGRDLAGPVRGAAGRCGGAAADLCQRHPARRPLGPGAAARHRRWVRWPCRWR